MFATQEQVNSLWWNSPVVFWHENQVALTFHSSLARTDGIENVIASLKLEDLNQFLMTSGFNLKSFTAKDVPHPEGTSRDEIEKLEAQLEMFEAELEALERSIPHRDQKNGQAYTPPRIRDIEELEEKIEELEREIEKREQGRGDNNSQAGNASNGQGQPGHSMKDLNSTTGKYLFNAPSGQGTIVVCFFHGQSSTMASSMSNMKSMMGRGRNDTSESDNTQAIVTLINRNLEKLRRDGGIPISAAMPNWIGGGTPHVGHGCPITPPIPVSGSDACASHPGSWPITLPQLSPTMDGLKGDGVTVFVLDTIPELDQIRTAAANAGDKNELLKDMVDRMDNRIPSSIPPAIMPPSIIIDHQQVPKRIATNIQTGKDIYQRLFGFEMPDHGLFVAGIIHDLAPKARIECIRVLNDFGIGDFAIICKALEDIQGRMETEAEKLGQVVVNMSLVITPANEEIAGLWFGDDFTSHAGDLGSMMQEVKLLRLGLHMVIKSLTTQGALVVAAAGNDSKADPRLSSMGMNMGMDMPWRLGPRYPAAFPEVISVGAVFKDGSAASYSNFPAQPPNHNGIATHGGGLPTPVPYNPAATPSVPIPPPGAKTWAIVTDAVVGVYSSSKYSMLSASDLPPADYPAPADSNAWAYWSGTSFATPVISAVTARVLQGLSTGTLSSSKSVQDIITTASGQQAILAGGTTLSNNTEFGVGVSVLTAEQNCQPAAMDAILSGSSGAVQKN
jgi:archaellum component FlaC